MSRGDKHHYHCPGIPAIAMFPIAQKIYRYRYIIMRYLPSQPASFAASNTDDDRVFSRTRTHISIGSLFLLFPRRRSIFISICWVFLYLYDYDAHSTTSFGNASTLSLSSSDFGTMHYDDRKSPYTFWALSQNPYLGWQPPFPHNSSSSTASSFSWRECFRGDDEGPTMPKDKTEPIIPIGCLEYDLGEPPQVEKDWVPDATMLRKMTMHGKDINGNPFPPPLSEELCEDIGSAGEGNSGDSNKECIRESRIRPANNGSLTYPTVSIDISNHNLTVGDDRKDSSTTTATSVSAPSILCLVYTLEDAHATRIRAIRELWAGGCDGFVAFSNRSDPRIPAISLEHEGPESYDNMWQKVRSIWRFVGIHYIQDYDWFYLGGDDLFLMPNNLKAYLAALAHKNESDPTTKEYYLGRRYNHKIRGLYNSG